MKIIILVKRNLLTLLFCLFLVCLVAFSKNNLSAAKDGLTLWATCVVPSLFPFFIATELLNYTNITSIFGKILNKVMRPVFNIPGEGAYALIMGIISGCPVGAKIVCDLYNDGKCTKDEAERMLAFTNNSGPLFIIGTVGILLFKDSSIGLLLFITHVLSAISVGIILGIGSRMCKTQKIVYNSRLKTYLRTSNLLKKIDNLHGSDKHIKTDNSISNLGEIMASSISKSVTNILQIGGFVVLFSVILSILNRLHLIYALSNLFTYINIPYDFSSGLISGIIELTNGINIICKIHTKTISDVIILCSFLLGFGGFSILLQVLSIISKFKLSIKNYLYGKILQGFFASFYTLLFIENCSMFNLDLPASSSSSNFRAYEIWLILIFLTLWILFIVANQKKKCHS